MPRVSKACVAVDERAHLSPKRMPCSGTNTLHIFSWIFALSASCLTVSALGLFDCGADERHRKRITAVLPSPEERLLGAAWLSARRAQPLRHTFKACIRGGQPYRREGMRPACHTVRIYICLYNYLIIPIIIYTRYGTVYTWYQV